MTSPTTDLPTPPIVSVSSTVDTLTSTSTETNLKKDEEETSRHEKSINEKPIEEMNSRVIQLPPFPPSIHQPFEQKHRDGESTTPSTSPPSSHLASPSSSSLPQPPPPPSSSASSSRLTPRSQRTNCTRCFRALHIKRGVSLNSSGPTKSSGVEAGNSSVTEEKSSSTSPNPTSGAFTARSHIRTPQPPPIGSQTTRRPATTGSKTRRVQQTSQQLCQACARATSSSPPSSEDHSYRRLTNSTHAMVNVSSSPTPVEPVPSSSSSMLLSSHSHQSLTVAPHPNPISRSSRLISVAMSGQLSPSVTCSIPNSNSNSSTFLTTVSTVRDQRSLCLALASTEQLSLTRSLEIELVRRSLASTIQESNTLRTRYETLVREHSQLHENKRTLENDLRTARQHEQETMTASEKLEEEHRQLHKEYAHLQEIFHGMHLELIQLKNEHEDNLLQRRFLEERLEELAKEKGHVTQELNLIKPQFLALEPQSRDFASMIRTLQSELFTSNQSLTTLRHQLDESFVLRAGAESSAQQSRDTCVQEQQAHERTKARVIVLEQCVKELQQHTIHVEEELSVSRNQLEYYRTELEHERHDLKQIHQQTDTQHLELHATNVRLKEHVERLEETAKKMSDELSTLKSTNSELQSRAEVAETKVVEIKSNQLTFEAAQQTLIAKIERLQTQLKDAQRLKEHYSHQLKHTKSACVTKDDTIKELQLETSQLHHQREQHRQHMESLQNDHSSTLVLLEQTRRRLTSEQEKYKERETTWAQRLTDAREDLQRNKATLAETNETHRHALKELRLTHRKLDRMNDKYERLQSRYEQLIAQHNQCTMYRKELESLRRLTTRQDHRLATTTSKNVILESEHRQDRYELHRMESLYEKEMKERHDLQNELTTLHEHDQQLQADFERARDEKVELSNQTKAAHMKEKEYRVQIGKLKKELKDSQSDVVRLREMLTSKDSQLRQLESDLTSAQSMASDHQDRMLVLRKEISQYEHDRSELHATRNELATVRTERIEYERETTKELFQCRQEYQQVKKELEEIKIWKDANGAELERKKTKIVDQEKRIDELESTITKFKKSSHLTPSLPSTDGSLKLANDTSQSPSVPKLAALHTTITTQEAALTQANSRIRAQETLIKMLHDQRAIDLASIKSAEKRVEIETKRVQDESEKTVQELKERYDEVVQRLTQKLDHQTSLAQTLTTKLRTLAAEKQADQTRLIQEAETDYVKLIKAVGDAGNGGNTMMTTDIHWLYRHTKDQLERVTKHTRDAINEVEQRLIQVTNQAREEKEQYQLELKTMENELIEARKQLPRYLWLCLESHRLLVSIPAQLGLTVLNSCEGLEINHGLLVTQLVDSGSDASSHAAIAEAGIQVNDVIETVNGHRMVDSNSLTSVLETIHAGEKIRIGLRRVQSDGTKEERMEVMLRTTSSHYTPHQLVILQRNARAEHFPEDDPILTQMLFARGIRPSN